jgi:putative restriction endonuclease
MATAALTQESDESPADLVRHSIIPDLAVELLSKSDTRKEMDRRLRDYFQADVRLVWLIQPKTQTAKMYTSPTRIRRVGKNQSLDGGEVLPGFTLPLRRLFAHPQRKPRKKVPPKEPLMPNPPALPRTRKPSPFPSHA